MIMLALLALMGALTGVVNRRKALLFVRDIYQKFPAAQARTTGD